MKRSVLSRITAFVLALVLVLGSVGIPVRAAENTGVTIKLHYNRPDGNYADWSVWFWIEGSESADVPFAEENGEMVATYPVADGATNVGFIVKLPNWAAKDVDADQFVDVAPYLTGTVHVYVQSGVEGYEIRPDTDVVTGIKIKEAVYVDGTGIRVVMTAPVENCQNAFSVSGLTVATVEDAGNNTYIITTQEEVDLLGSYTLTCGAGSCQIRMPNIYSTQDFENQYTYEGDDLGASWTKDKTTFRLWAPTAASVKVNLYESGTAGTDDLLEQLDMSADIFIAKM